VQNLLYIKEITNRHKLKLSESACACVWCQ